MHLNKRMMHSATRNNHLWLKVSQYYGQGRSTGRSEYFEKYSRGFVVKDSPVRAGSGGNSNVSSQKERSRDSQVSLPTIHSVKRPRGSVHNCEEKV